MDAMEVRLKVKKITAVDHAKSHEQCFGAKRIPKVPVLDDFGRSFGIPSFHEKNTSVPEDLQQQDSQTYRCLCTHLGLIDLDYVEHELFVFICGLKCGCIVCGQPSLISAKYEKHLCADCEDMVERVRKHKHGNLMLVRLFAKQPFSASEVASLFETAYGHTISEYVGRSDRARAIYVVSSDWVWRLFEQWHMLPQNVQFPQEPSLALPPGVPARERVFCSMCGREVFNDSSAERVITCEWCINEMKSRIGQKGMETIMPITSVHS